VHSSRRAAASGAGSDNSASEEEECNLAEPFVLATVDGRIGWLTLNDPARLNPVNGDRILELNAAAQEMSARDDVSVVVVTGAGRAFCAGADISGSRYTGPASFDPHRRPHAPASAALLGPGPGLWTLTGMRQPVIAMVNGPAVGFGFELALQADIRLASDSARFGGPFVKLGTVSDTGAGTWLLPRLVGWSRAAEILYTGRLVPADEAAQMGLVSAVHPADQLQEATDRLATEIATGSPWSLRTMKQMLFAGLDETKGAHVLSQYFHVNTGDPSFDRNAYLDRVRSRRAARD
jgi:enoyl-CoA hydratase/carnithine racemase